MRISLEALGHSKDLDEVVANRYVLLHLGGRREVPFWNLRNTEIPHWLHNPTTPLKKKEKEIPIKQGYSS